MSTTYDYYDHSNFPDQLDMEYPWRDPTASEVVLINQYNVLIASGQLATATELLSANPSLMDCIINASKLLRLQHGILAVQKFFFDSVQNQIFRIGSLKGDWNSSMSSTATGDNKLNMFDVVKYPINGVKQYFSVISSEIVAGTLPTDTTKYMQLSMKGDKGDAGQDGTNGSDGASGLGLSPRGAWVNNLQYFQYDLVSHNGYLWYCLQNNLAEEPTDVSTIWVKINIALQVSYGITTPTNLANGGVWLHLQDNGRVVMKTKQENGEFIAIYPETKAEYIRSANGENLQRMIYQHTFDRDDIDVTVSAVIDDVMTTSAKLKSNPSIVVVTNVTTDTMDTNNQMTSEFTVYDNTGVYVMYKTTTTITENEDESLTITKTVII